MMRETSSREKAVVVGVVAGKDRRERAGEYLDELVLLADTAGAEVCHTITQERERVNSATFIGSGKAEEIASLVEGENVTLVIFDDDLSPVQVRNLEKVIKCKIIDRSGLILDIFASRAKTKECFRFAGPGSGRHRPRIHSAWARLLSFILWNLSTRWASFFPRGWSMKARHSRLARQLALRYIF